MKKPVSHDTYQPRRGLSAALALVITAAALMGCESHESTTAAESPAASAQPVAPPKPKAIANEKDAETALSNFANDNIINRVNAAGLAPATFGFIESPYGPDPNRWQTATYAKSVGSAVCDISITGVARKYSAPGGDGYAKGPAVWRARLVGSTTDRHVDVAVDMDIRGVTIPRDASLTVDGTEYDASKGGTEKPLSQAVINAAAQEVDAMMGLCGL